jgi:ribosomal protein S18 acetylase RimI-like enzyme
MLVRPMTEEDWESFVELRMRALGDAPDSFRQTLEDEKERLRTARWVEPSQRSAEAPDRESWVAEVNGLALGQAFSRLSEDGSTVHIFAMWVAPEARGQGVGRALLGAAEAWGRDRGVARGYLAVTAGNSAAERLYTRAGYEPTGDREPLREGSDLECVWMAKPL